MFQVPFALNTVLLM